MFPNHVRGNNPGSTTAPHYNDAGHHRIQTNPQPIPGSRSIPGGIAGRNQYNRATNYSGAPGSASAQSPHQSAQYFTTPPGAAVPLVGGASPHETRHSYANVMSGATATSTSNIVNASQQPNSQLFRMPSSYTQQIQAAAYQPSNVKYAIHTSQPANPNSYQAHNVSPAGVQASPSNLMPAPANNYMYFPNPHHVQHPRFVNVSNSTTGGAPVQATSPSWQIPQQQYFPQHMPPPMTYPQYQDVIQTPQPPPISTPQMMPSAPTPAAPPSSGRKSRGIVIKDPNTGQDVTNDVLSHGRQSESGQNQSSTLSSSPSVTSTSHPAPTNTDHIAAKFAAQVAAAAGSENSAPASQTPTTKPAVEAQQPSEPAKPAPTETQAPAAKKEAVTLAPVASPPVPSAIPANTPQEKAAAEPAPEKVQEEAVAPVDSAKSDVTAPAAVEPKAPVVKDAAPSKPEETAASAAKPTPVPTVEPVKEPEVPAPILSEPKPVPVKESAVTEVSKSAEVKEVKKEEKAAEVEKPVAAVADEVIAPEKASVPEPSKEETPAPITNGDIHEKSPATPTEAPSKDTKVLTNGISSEAGTKQAAAAPVVDKKPVVAKPEPVKEVKAAEVTKDIKKTEEPAVKPEPVAVAKPKKDSTKSVEKPITPVEEKTIELPTTDNVTIKPVIKEPPVVTDNQPPAVVKPVAVKPVPATDVIPPTTESSAEQPAPQQPAVVKPAAYKPAIGKSASAEPPKTAASNAKESSKSVDMKFNYRDDQWSPARQDGKKVYTSNFLLQFRTLDIALSKPKNLPTGIEDIILNQPIKSRNDVSNTPFNDLYMGDSGRSDFTPNYMSGGHHGHGGGGRGGSRGPGRHGPGGRQPSMTKTNKVIKLPVREKVPELKSKENAWKPKAKETETDETAEVLRSVRSILNKLTPQKFQPLMQQVQKLAINTEERLRGVINLIFEKAIDEPNFCEAYANMCRVMSSNQLRVEKSGQQQPVLEFRKVLLTRCQKEFEKDKSNEEKLQKLRDDLEAAPEDKKEEIKANLQDATKKERRRTLGNIRFIGELFKLSMLTETIMHNCILQLFRARTDEDSLESLCRLLTTIGKDLDHEKGQSRMDQYFGQMKKIISEKKVSSRVRFMLQDVIDLRLNRWTPRAVQNQGPKTIDQIHADAEKEKELEKARTAQVSMAASKSHSRGGGGRMGSRGNHNQHNEDSGGWNKVPQKPVRYDPQKMKLSKTSFDESKVTLGPNRAGKGWKSGSGSGTRTGSSGGGYSSSSSREHLDTSNQSSRASTPTMINRFSALAGSNADQTSPYMSRKTNSRERVGGPRNSREKATSRDRRTPSKDRTRTPPLNRDSMERKSSYSSNDQRRQDLIETTRRMTSNEERRQSPSPHSNRSSGPVKSGITMDETAATKKIKSIIKEYMSIVDVNEAMACYTEEMDHSFAYLFIQLAMEESLERKTQDRTNIAKLLIEVVKSSKISIESYIKGVSNIMTDAVDLEIDLPKIWTYLAELIGPVLANNFKVLGLNCLLEITKPLMEFEKAHVFVAEIVLNLLKDLDKSTIQQEWSRSNLLWSFFCDDKSYVKDYLDRKNLLFLMDATPDPTLEIRRRLSEMLVRDNEVSNEEMFMFIEKTFKPDEVTSSVFVRALTAAICHHAISKMSSEDKQGMENGKNIIKSRTLLFKKYVDGEAKELQAVYAMQKLNHELDSPPNTLRHIFDLLYDEEVVSEQTFFSWEKDNNPEESEGKGVALLSVKPFFTWLREADPEEADE